MVGELAPLVGQMKIPDGQRALAVEKGQLVMAKNGIEVKTLKKEGSLGSYLGQL